MKLLALAVVVLAPLGLLLSQELAGVDGESRVADPRVGSDDVSTIARAESQSILDPRDPVERSSPDRSEPESAKLALASDEREPLPAPEPEVWQATYGELALEQVEALLDDVQRSYSERVRVLIETDLEPRRNSAAFIPVEAREPACLYVHSRRDGQRITFELLPQDYPQLFHLKSELDYLTARAKALRDG